MAYALSVSQVAKMIDLSAVRGQNTLEDVQQTISLAKKYGCVAVFALGGFTPYVIQQKREHAYTFHVGATVGFPDGGQLTDVKVFEARRMVELGADEIDMVQNYGYVLSGKFDYVEAEITAVKKAIGEIPLKVILECAYLTDEQIILSAKAAMNAGADWVKSGTGWASPGTSLRNIQLMKETVGDRLKVKAAGGIRDLKTLLEMHDAGAERFGIGVKTAQGIFAELSE
ncbi:MAG: deoxyribose-phosphate aldolase [Planctomycetia bacterium]|nr:deoxyribose-phosphate aldolase [Planctomycetia bacterium]